MAARKLLLVCLLAGCSALALAQHGGEQLRRDRPVGPPMQPQPCAAGARRGPPLVRLGGGPPI